MIGYLKISLRDINLAYKRKNLAFILGWQDIKQRYRRSKLGPFWITISMGVMIFMIGLVFGQVLQMPMDEYLPFLSIGMILWTFFSSAIMEGCTAYIDSQGMIRQLCLPMSIFTFRVMWRNIVILAHNLVILPFVFLFVENSVSKELFWALPGFVVLTVNIFWLSLLLAILSTRFRDMPQIINSLLQVFFYITPVIWMPNTLSPRSTSLLVDPNPVYHLMELVRAPLLGHSPTLLNWQVSLLTAMVGCAITFVFFGKYKKRIAYWL